MLARFQKCNVNACRSGHRKRRPVIAAAAGKWRNCSVRPEREVLLRNSATESNTSTGRDDDSV
jgi:hypothetical protein